VQAQQTPTIMSPGAVSVPPTGPVKKIARNKITRPALPTISPWSKKPVKKRIKRAHTPTTSSIAMSSPAISSTPSTQVPIAPAPNVNLPPEFSDDGAHADVVTVGSSRNGKIEAWKIGDTDFALYRYDENSPLPDAWVKQITKDGKGTVIPAFDDVCASSDGIVCAISSAGKAFMLNTSKNYWEEIPASNAKRLKFGKISVGNAQNFWAIEKATNNIYQLLFNKEINVGGLTIKSNEWIIKSVNGLDVAAGIDGTVIALNTQNKVYQLVNNTWKEFPGVLLTHVAVASKDIIWATFDRGPVHEIWKFMPDVKTPTWQKVKGANEQDAEGFVHIAINAGGTIFATDDIGTIYTNGDAGVVIVPVTPEELKQQQQSGQPGQFVQLDAGHIATKSKASSKRTEAKKAGKVHPIQPDPKIVAQKKLTQKKVKVAKPGMRRGGPPVVTVIQKR